jgi:Zn-dependent peptidase ImmA (M78 family)
MSAETTMKDGVGLNPDMLRWAREWRGRSLEEAASKVNKTPADVAGWEENRGKPTVRQARILADFYERPFLEFFLPSPPVVPLPELVPDFRMQSGTTPPKNDRDLRAIQQWAETQRVNALDLLSELGEQPAEIPEHLFATLTTEPARAAERARHGISFPIEEQIGLKKSEADLMPNILREKFEAIGILTLRRADLKDFRVRGICLAIFPLPVIVFRSEALTAQSFTLAHELAHILLRESGITGYRSRSYNTQPVERWCDQFAASFLMPSSQILALIGPAPKVPAATFDDENLTRFADVFRVSPHAMLIRLVHLGYVQPAYYWDVKKPEFDKEEAAYKSGARATYYGSRYKSSLGDLYTGLVLAAWGSGRITNHNAAEFMGIKRLTHLYDIKAHFGKS